MQLLFSYGTLRDPAVQQKLFGRQLRGSADELPGYACVSIVVADAYEPVEYARVMRQLASGRDAWVYTERAR